MKKLAVFLVGIMLIFGLRGVAGALPITNGDFENGLTGWDFVRNVMTTNNGSANDYAIFNASGNAFDARLYQQFYLDPSLTELRINYDVYLMNSAADNDFFRTIMRIDIGGGLASAGLNLINVTTQTNSSTGWYNVELLASLDPNIVNTDPNTRLTFALVEGLNQEPNNSSVVWLDNVSVNPVNPVPEPATFTLLAVSLIGTVAIGRKKIIGKKTE